MEAGGSEGNTTVPQSRRPKAAGDGDGGVTALRSCACTGGFAHILAGFPDGGKNPYPPPHSPFYTSNRIVDGPGPVGPGKAQNGPCVGPPGGRSRARPTPTQAQPESNQFLEKAGTPRWRWLGSSGCGRESNPNSRHQV